MLQRAVLDGVAPCLASGGDATLVGLDAMCVRADRGERTHGVSVPGTNIEHPRSGSHRASEFRVGNKAWNKLSSTSANANRPVDHTGGETVGDMLLVGGGVPGIEIIGHWLCATEAAVRTDQDGKVTAKSLTVIGSAQRNPTLEFSAHWARTLFIAHGVQRTGSGALR